ncbi:MAG TPA: hypothetical protein VK116_05515, partial [Planctomycetota bacterium]|nr:hypothetical protein [Planctomycetota bacterium]
AFAGNTEEAMLAAGEAEARAGALEDDWPHVVGIVQSLLKLAEGAADEALELARSTAARIDGNPPPLHARRSLDRLVEHVQARIEAARAE